MLRLEAKIEELSSDIQKNEADLDAATKIREKDCFAQRNHWEKLCAALLLSHPRPGVSPTHWMQHYSKAQSYV